MTQLRLAVLADYPEEGWPSMDLCAQMLLEFLAADQGHCLTAEEICPPFVRRLGRLPGMGRWGVAFNGDRLLNRFWDYPRSLRRGGYGQGDLGDSGFDCFHVADHSYAQLVHELPPERTGVFCHDLDTFRSLLVPEQEPRPFWFRAMSRRILSGLQKAAVVFYSTEAVRSQIEQYSCGPKPLLDPQRLIHAPYGIDASFTPDLASEVIETQVLQWVGDDPFLLHVGSCIGRKRVDVLLAVLAQVRQRWPGLRLVKVGGDWSAEHLEQIEQLQLQDAIIHLRDLERQAIAALYRRAALVLQPSEAEGFGLPVVEALACGAMVIASDIPVLREVGGDGVVYCPVGAVSQWVESVHRILMAPEQAPTLTRRLAQAGRYSWSVHAEIIAEAYQVLGATRP